jgi:hypothetical protein
VLHDAAVLRDHDDALELLDELDELDRLAS